MQLSRIKSVQPDVKPNRIDLITAIAALNFDHAWSKRIGGPIDGIPG